MRRLAGCIRQLAEHDRTGFDMNEGDRLKAEIMRLQRARYV